MVFGGAHSQGLNPPATFLQDLSTCREEAINLCDKEREGLQKLKADNHNAAAKTKLVF
jgi:hypothetical protein